MRIDIQITLSPEDKERLEQTLQRLVDRSTPQTPATTPIGELELSVRAYTCLENEGIKTVQQLCSMTAAEVLRIKNLGRKSLNEIHYELGRLGLHLNGSEIWSHVQSKPEPIESVPAKTTPPPPDPNFELRYNPLIKDERTCDLSQEIKDCLISRNITTFGQLSLMSLESLQTVHNVPAAFLKDIVRCMDWHRLKFRP